MVSLEKIASKVSERVHQAHVSFDERQTDALIFHDRSADKSVGARRGTA
jgi:hypothetical protein